MTASRMSTPRILTLLAGLWLALHSLPGATPVRLITDWYPQPEHGGFYQAMLKGYYRDAGIEIEIMPGGPNTFAVQRVAMGRAEFGMGSGDDVLTANDRGIPIVAVGMTMQNDPQGVMVHESSPVRSLADLENHTVAVVPGTAWFPYLVRKYGFKNLREVPHTFSVGSFVKDPNYIQMCFITSEPYFAQLQGAHPRVMLISESGYAPYRVFFTRREFLQKNEAVVRAFVEASLRGWREYLVDPAAVNQELSRRNPELTKAKMEYSVRVLAEKKFVLGDPAKGEVHGRMLAKRWQAQYDLLRDLKVIRGDFKLADAWTDAFAPKP
jgi:NitT/TauT family transport system substrate-binding protein